MSEPPHDAPTTTPIVLGYARATAKPSQGLAIAALVCGLVSIPGLAVGGLGALLGLAALVLGIVAVVEARRKPVEYRGLGMAVAGICCGTVSLVLTVVFLVALAVVVRTVTHRVGAVQTLMQSSVCQMNMERVGVALSSYEGERKAYPSTLQVLAGTAYLSGNAEALKCPTAASPGRTCDYYYVPPPTEPEVLRQAQQAAGKWIVAYEDAANHPEEGVNVLHLDGHVSAPSAMQFAQELAQFKAEYEKVVGQPPTIIPPR